MTGIITGKRSRRVKRCACGAPLPPLAITHEDPYCSTECCQAAHGVKYTGVPVLRVRRKS